MASSVNSSEVVFNTVEGEQTIDDDSMFRPMSLANLPELNNDPSADKSTTAYKMWNDYRESKSPNDDVEEDEEIDENGGQEEGSTPRIRELMANKSFAARLLPSLEGDRHAYHGFSSKELYDKLEKATKENLNLKIRIHYLEENQGLGDRPDQQENVFRINLDLKVANECLKQEIEEKDEQIRDVLRGIEQLEEESKEKRLREERLFEEERLSYQQEIEALKRRLEDKAESNEVRQSLLGEAFGSILDPAPEDKYNAEFEEKINGMQEKIESLEKELQIERDHAGDMKKLLEEHEFKQSEVETELKEREHILGQMAASKDEAVQALENQVVQEQERIQMVQEELEQVRNVHDQIQYQNEALRKQLEMEQQSAELQRARNEEEITQLNDEILALKKALDEESSSGKSQETYLNLKLAEIAKLHKEVDNLTRAINDKDQELTKLKTGLDALAQVAEDQNNTYIKVTKELNKKNMMYDRLVSEYEIAKAKVRKYRSERANNSSTSVASHSQVSVGLDAPQGQDNVKASFYMKQGADKALAKAKTIYNNHIKKMDENHGQMMKLMRQRLEELAMCLEQILNNGLLDISSSVREILQASLNESRRLSTLDGSTVFDNEFGSFGPQPELGYVEVTLDDLELEINNAAVDIDNVVNEVRAEYESKILQLNQAHQSEIEQYNTLLADNEEAVAKIDQCTEKIKFLEAEKTDLRIKCTNGKDKIKLLEEELHKLKDNNKLAKLQNEAQNLRDQLKELRAAKQMDEVKVQEANDEAADLKRQLEEALEKIRQYKERQESVDRALRHQLAKTHSVLKRTKTAMDSIENKEN